MPMQDDQQRNLDLFNRFLGWGTPASALWFVGLEEATVFDERYLTTLRRREAAESEAVSDGSRVYWQTVAMMKREKSRKPGPLDVAEAQLISELNADWLPRGLSDDDVSRSQWRYSFHCNLYPLGYNRSDGPLPAEPYRLLCGVATTEDDAFQLAITRRHKWLREIRERYRPAAVVCFGMDSRAQFEKALELRDGAVQKWEGGNPLVYPNRTVIAYHASGAFSRHRFNATRPQLISLLRDQWNVAIGG